jgi:hypothetical protein
MQANHLNEIIRNNMLQYAFSVNDNLLAVKPIAQGFVLDDHGAKGALMLIGYLGEKPVFRTTHTAAHRKYAFFKIQNILAKYFFSIDLEEKGIFRIHLATIIS